MATQAQIEANRKYKKQNVKRITIDFYPSDMELYEHIQTKEKKQTYIKELVRNDLNNSCKEK